ncbi:MAG: PEP/pyruvate-binding domain-containing protein [Hylemonella sp.]
MNAAEIAASGDWPAELFAIACPSAPAPIDPSAQRMGFKAYNLWRMARAGLPVPPGFVLGTAYCTDAQRRRLGADPATWRGALAALEAASGRRLGDARRPLLVSVRSGAAVSMPGMMETLLNIGLNDTAIDGLVALTGQPRLAWDAYRRLVSGFGEIVAGLPKERFEAEWTAVAAGRAAHELAFDELRAITRRCLAAYATATGQPFPQNPYEQLQRAIGAVFASWDSPKARHYRSRHGLDDSPGTAVTVQAMVFGNAGSLSGAGVGFTRNPIDGQPAPWVDFLFDAQGEDVVSGRRRAHGHAALAARLPAVWRELQTLAPLLEALGTDMQEFEFTVEQGRLYLLQTRDGKRTAVAAARIALDLLAAGSIDRATAQERTAGLDRAALQLQRLIGNEERLPQPLAEATPASPGVAAGEIALDEMRVRTRQAAGASVILVRRDAETADIAALDHAAGLLTQRGARTAHAAVIARQLGRVCLVGCSELEIDLNTRSIRFGPHTLQEGDPITLDANQGRVYPGLLRAQAWVDEDLLQRLTALHGSAPAECNPDPPGNNN